MKLRVIFTSLLSLITLFTVAQKLDLSQLENLNIRNVGPANMSGRITAIDVVDSDTKTMYVGAASGGVWKSENGGSAWTPIFDDQPTQNIGAIAIQQNEPNVIWAGTGEGNPRNSMNLGMGIFKSTDGGSTWQHVGLEKTKVIHRIIIDPEDGNTVYVGAMGDPFDPNEDRGLYKTTDGGKSWKKMLYTNEMSGIADMVLDPQNPNKLFVAMYEHRRTPYYFTSGGSGSGLYVTTNKGESWEKLGEAHGLPKGNLGRIGIAIAPSNTNRIYAKVEAEKNALYRSDDGGKSWKVINDNPKFTNNRPFYFQDLAVDSKDPDRLYNIYQPLSVSYDGGVTFDPTPMIPADETKGIHADFHSFWVNKDDPQHFIIGGDGGIGITQDHGKSWYFPETIPVAQFYHINVDEDMPYNIYGGMQDNGNWFGPAYTWKRGGIRTLYWQYLVGGDGFYISPDAENSRFGYGTSQNGDLYRYDKVSGYYQSIKPHSVDDKTPLRFNWNAGFAKDPFDTKGLYYGSQFLHVTHDKGATWEVISPDLSTNNQDQQKGDYGGLTLDISGAEMYNSILSISPSPLDQNIIWVGTDDGQIQLTKDGGKSWSNMTKNVPGMPKEAWIAQIKASTYKSGTAWMVVNNYRKGDYLPYLFKTDDYGENWKRMVDESQVKGYALTLIQDPIQSNLVFLGTENGLWISIDEGAHWVQFKNGFPSVSTMDLAIQQRESALIVGTFGRSIWVLDDLLSLREIAANNLNKGITALPMNDAVQVKGLFIAPPGNIWSGFHTTFEGENKVFQKTKIPFYLNVKPLEGQAIEAHVYDSQNELINTVTYEPKAKGLDYMIWKLDEKSNYLPGAWIHDETRGIPVLPGNYKIVIKYGEMTDETTVKVISDPRFELDESVDQALYQYKKSIDQQVKRLGDLLNEIDDKVAQLDTLKKQYAGDLKKSKVIDQFKTKVKELKAKGKTARPDRQVGAWQTLAISPYSKVNDVLQIAMARMNIPSAQEIQLLEEATLLVAAFEKEVNAFNKTKWISFMNKWK